MFVRVGKLSDRGGVPAPALGPNPHDHGRIEMAKSTLLPQRGAYAIRCNDGRSYVGGSNNVRLRWLQHRSALRLGKHSNRLLQAAWMERGEEAFGFVLLEVIEDHADLIATEQRWMDLMRSVGTLFNIAPKAGSNAKIVRTVETRQKIAAAGRGRKHTARQTAKISSANRGNAHSAGERNRHAVLGSSDIPVIRSMIAAGVKHRVIAAQYGVGSTTISHIATGRNWSHVP